MKFIISYDISNSYKRKEISDFLNSCNFLRIQKSVFLGEIENEILIEKISILESFLNDKKDSVLISPLCSEDFMKSCFLGKTFDIKHFEKFKNFLLF